MLQRTPPVWRTGKSGKTGKECGTERSFHGRVNGVVTSRELDVRTEMRNAAAWYTPGSGARMPPMTHRGPRASARKRRNRGANWGGLRGAMEYAARHHWTRVACSLG
jgi:hypothetical protein